MLTTPHSPLPPPSRHELEAHHRRAALLAGLDIDSFPNPRSLHLVVDGIRLHLLDWGAESHVAASEPPLLFLHGGGQTARTWDLCCLALRRHRRCLALDQRGHGDSEWSLDGDYQPTRHARDLCGILDQLAIPRVALVGMSMGCLNGLEFALAHPRRVAAFVAVDAGPWVALPAARSIGAFMAAADGAPSIEALVRLALEFNPRRNPDLLATSLRHNVRRRPDGRLTWKSDRRFGIDFDAMERLLEDLQRRIHGLIPPTLIVRGGASDVFSDADAERFARSVPNGRWQQIEGAGHTVQGDAPAALVTAIERFLIAENGQAHD